MGRKKQKIKVLHKMGVLLLCVACVGMTGCARAKTAMDIPPLVEPKVMNEAFRPVGYGDVGKIEYRDAVVVPTYHCHFWENSTMIEEIHVELGEYVEEGTLLATADIEQAQEMMDSIATEKENCKQAHTIANIVHEEKLKELGYKQQGFLVLEDEEGANQTNKEISVLKENHRYDELLYEYKMSQYDRKLSEYSKIVKDGKLYARNSGYVCYVKNTEEPEPVKPAENVVVIADYEKVHLELTNETIRQNICEKYTSIYTINNGVKYELKEYAYQDFEVLAAEGRDLYPRVRLKFEDESLTPPVGNCVPVFFEKDSVENVLCIAKDSLYEDDDGYYVYVKTDTGKEVRPIKIGKKDAQSVQVISGLSEGEEVFYSSEAVAPTEYELYTANLDKYEDIQKTEAIYKVETKLQLVHSEYEGEIVEVSARYDDEVEKGAVICKIKIKDGSAALADMKNAMEKHTTLYQRQQKMSDEMIAALMEARNQPVEQEVEVKDKDGNVEKVKQYITRPYMAEELTCQIAVEKIKKEQAQTDYEYQLKIMQENYKKAKENNDGSGVISICAEQSGKIKDINLSVGKKIKVGDVICRIASETSPYVNLLLDYDVQLNQKVEFVDEGIEEIYTGTVVGLSGDSLGNQVFITSLEDGVYITQGSLGDLGRGAQAFVKMDDEEYYTNYSLKGDKYAVCSAKTISNIYTFPFGVVNSEKLILEDEILYFVWKVENGQLVKQYVQYLYSTVDKDGFRRDCVINGIKEGDVLALNRNMESSEMIVNLTSNSLNGSAENVTGVFMQ